jgi:hypothetical protein
MVISILTYITGEKVRRVVDGSPCVVVRDGKEIAMYFALKNASSEGFVCPLLGSERGTLTVERKLLQRVDYLSLSEESQDRYLAELDADVAKRLEINLPFLFNDHADEMLKARCALMKDSSREKIVSMFGLLKRDNRITSSQLSASNNTALMLVASLHATLAGSGEQDWYTSFKKGVAESCKNCNLKSGTLERYQGAGGLMLRSRVLACMLPSFVASNATALGKLLDDQAVVRGWEEVFEKSLTMSGGEKEKKIM